MKLELLEAIEKLKEMLDAMPAGQLITLDGQKREAALQMAIEALRRQAGYPPNLPGYVTVEKTKMLNMKPFQLRVNLGRISPVMRCYIGRQRLELLAAVFGNKVVTYTERTCYKDSEPLVCGLPVIYGDDKELDDYIYLVAPERKK